MGTPEHRRAQPGEVYVALSDTTVVFPAVVEEERWEGFVKPRFDRPAAEAVVAWLNENHGRDPLVGHFTVTFDGDVLAVIDTSGRRTDRIEPDAELRYAIGGGWVWELAAPEGDAVAEAALLADARRLVPDADELLVTINITGADPVFPALPDAAHGWSRAGTPRFRPDVAAVVVAWLNDLERRYPGGTAAYWEDDTVVLVDWLAATEDGYLPTRVSPDEDGRYAIGIGFEWERVDKSAPTDD